MMKRDGVGREDVNRLMTAVRRHRTERAAKKKAKSAA